MKHSPEERQRDGDFAPFLSSGYYAVPGNFREIDDFTNPCILWSENEKKNDLPIVMNLLVQKKPIDAYIISVPDSKRENYILNDFEKPKDFPKYLSVADARFYDEDFGFMTELENENE